MGGILTAEDQQMHMHASSEHTAMEKQYRLLSADVDRLLAKVPAAHLQCGIFELYFG